MTTSNDPVAAVCGTQVRLYGPANERTGIRPLQAVIDCPHRGAALDLASEYERKPDAAPMQGGAS